MLQCLLLANSGSSNLFLLTSAIGRKADVFQCGRIGLLLTRLGRYGFFQLDYWLSKAMEFDQAQASQP